MLFRSKALADKEAAALACTESTKATPHAAKRLSQWSSANEIDPLLVDVFADEEGAETVPGRTESAI